MVIWKKKRMVDVRELQRRGIVPKNPDFEQESVETDDEGFASMSDSMNSSSVSQSQESSSPTTSSFGDFFDVGTNSSSSTDSGSFSTESNGYSKREVDERIEEMDNKIYKLEQRIDVLERKAGVGSGY